jgi:hypothetical protein
VNLEHGAAHILDQAHRLRADVQEVALEAVQGLQGEVHTPLFRVGADLLEPLDHHPPLLLPLDVRDQIGPAHRGVVRSDEQVGPQSHAGVDAVLHVLDAAAHVLRFVTAQVPIGSVKPADRAADQVVRLQGFQDATVVDVAFLLQCDFDPLETGLLELRKQGGILVRKCPSEQQGVDSELHVDSPFM